MAKKLDEQWDHFAELSLREGRAGLKAICRAALGLETSRWATLGMSRGSPRLKQGCRRRNHARTPDGACWRSP